MLKGSEVAGQHVSYLEAIHYEFASYVVPFNEKRSGIGVSAHYLGSENMAGRAPGGASTGDFDAHYAAYSIAFGHQLQEHWSLGITGKAIESKLSDVSAQAYAADIGTLYRPIDSLRLAAAVTNIGSKLKFEQQGDPLPLAWHLSAAYRLNQTLMTMVEGVGDRDGTFSGRTGIEWRPVPLLALRAGYRTDVLKGLSALAGVSTGLGIELWGQEFAYAWVPYGDLGDSQYFSVVIRFGDHENERRNLIQYHSIKMHRLVSNSPYNGQTNEEFYDQLLEALMENASERDALAPLVK